MKNILNKLSQKKKNLLKTLRHKLLRKLYNCPSDIRTIMLPAIIALDLAFESFETADLARLNLLKAQEIFDTIYLAFSTQLRGGGLPDHEINKLVSRWLSEAQVLMDEEFPPRKPTLQVIGNDLTN